MRWAVSSVSFNVVVVSVVGSACAVVVVVVSEGVAVVSVFEFFSCNCLFKSAFIAAKMD